MPLVTPIYLKIKQNNICTIFLVINSKNYIFLKEIDTQKFLQDIRMSSEI